MKHYTEIVPFEVAKRLAAAGYGQKDYGSIYTEDGTHIGCAMPSPVRGMTYSAPTYADVLDWLLERGYIVMVVPSIDPEDYKVGMPIPDWDSFLNGDKICHRVKWGRAADMAITEALEILEEKK